MVDVITVMQHKTDETARAYVATLADHYGHGWLAGRAALEAENRRLRARVEELERKLADIRRLT